MIIDLKRILLFSFVALLSLSAEPHSAKQLKKTYGSMPEAAYLSGAFEPMTHPDFVELKSIGLPTNNRKHFLRREAAQALLKMYQAFRRENPGVPFRVISSTRNFFAQKSIWEGKWSGRRRVDGKKLNLALPDPLQRGRKILQFSSMPGTSRHHWGTDFDLNDLSNEYFMKGVGARLFKWLRKNGGKYGFCQPYTAGRQAGYEEERWHWSYRPLARFYLNEWMSNYRRNQKFFAGSVGFAGAAEMRKLAPIYVQSINGECF